MRRRDRLQDALAIKRLHLDRGAVDRVDLVAPGARLGDRALQDVLGGRAPYPDLDAVALLESIDERQQVPFGKARIEGERAFFLRQRQHFLDPVGAFVAQQVLRECRWRGGEPDDEREPFHGSGITLTEGGSPWPRPRPSPRSSSRRSSKCARSSSS